MILDGWIDGLFFVLAGVIAGRACKPQVRGSFILETDSLFDLSDTVIHFLQLRLLNQTTMPQTSCKDLVIFESGLFWLEENVCMQVVQENRKKHEHGS